MNNLILHADKKYIDFFHAYSVFVLQHPKGTFLITEIIRAFDAQEFDRIVILVDKKFMNNSGLLEEIKQEIFDEFNIEPDFYAIYGSSFRLPTVIKNCIKLFKLTGGLLYVDCEHIFTLGNYTIPTDNTMVVADLRKFPELSAANKRFANFDNNTTTLCENNINGNYIVLAFFFKDAYEYREHHRKAFSFNDFSLSKLVNVLSATSPFQKLEVKYCYDISTSSKLKQYMRKFQILFVSLDGVLVKKKNKHYYSRWYREEVTIHKNVRTLNELYDKGYWYIIIITNRPEREELFGLLKELNIKYHRVIGDLPDSAITLLTCFDVGHPNPNATAINLPRNTDLLRWSINPND
jgi:hypothetical protein